MLKQKLTGSGVDATYIEDVFSTYLYTGNGSTQTITNGIDLSTKGGLVWTKDRSSAVNNNLVNTVAGNTQYLVSNNTGAQQTTSPADNITSFNTNGYSLGADTATNQVNYSGEKYVSWTFRKQPKFFDVVTWTGDGTGARDIPHSLGSVPGCIITKRLDSSNAWLTYHRSQGFGTGNGFALNTTDGYGTWTTPASATSSTTFTTSNLNASGATYVAYLFAHDAGGFGLTGTDNVITCGSYTVSGNVATVTLGYEPQFTITKCTSATDNWRINDVMRGSATAGGQNASLQPDTSNAESAGTAGTHPTATGFTVQGVADGTYIYIAIRRGPMKVPTDGTKVYNGITRTGTSAAASITGVGFTPDFIMARGRTGGFESMIVDRLRGNTQDLLTDSTAAENTLSSGSAGTVGFTLMDGMGIGTYIYWNDSGTPFINHFFKRAPGFFDEVCYTGTGANTTVSHNLGVVPELIISKTRSVTAYWAVYHKDGGSQNPLLLNDTGAWFSDSTYWNTNTHTATTFSVGANTRTNVSGGPLVAYLFATCPGVSKVGSYTGNGSSQTINCGFTAGARFVLIKRTDSTGDWYMWDTARGIVSGNDPHLSLNTTAAEVTTDDTIDPDSTGFVVNQLSATNVNVSSATYIYLAIA